MLECTYSPNNIYSLRSESFSPSLNKWQHSILLYNYQKYANSVYGPNGDVFLVVLLFNCYSFRCDGQYRRDFWRRKNCCCPSVIRSVNVFSFICISSYLFTFRHASTWNRKARDVKKMTQGAVGNVADWSERYLCWFIEKIIHSTVPVLKVWIYERMGEEFNVELHCILTEWWGTLNST